MYPLTEQSANPEDSIRGFSILGESLQTPKTAFSSSSYLDMASLKSHVEMK